jgi:hypothetical protein
MPIGLAKLLAIGSLLVAERSLVPLRSCEKIRKRRARARKAVWQGARESASPQRAVTERATQPDGLSCSRPQGCVSFWLGLRCPGATADRGRQPAEGSPQGDAKHRQHAAGIATALTPWPSQKSSSNAALCNFFTGSKRLLKNSALSRVRSLRRTSAEGRRSIPKKGTVTEERRRKMPQSAHALRVAPIIGPRCVANLVRSAAACGEMGTPQPHQACAWLRAIFRELTATWHG